MNKMWMTGVALAAATLSASAQQAYVEGGLGVTAARVDCEGMLSCDKTSTGGKLLVGLQLTPELSVEAGGFDLGEVQASFIPFFSDVVTARVRTHAGYLGGAFRLKTGLPDVSLLLRGGLARVTTRSTYNSAFFTNETATDWRPLVGAAARWHLSPELALVAGVDATRSAELDVGGSGRVMLYSLGASYTFDSLAAAAWVGGALSDLGSDARDAWAKTGRRYYAYGLLGQVRSDALDPIKHQNQSRQYEFGRNPVGLRLGVGRRWGPVWSTELALTDYGTTKFRTAAGVSPSAQGQVAAAGLSAMSVWRAPTLGGLTWVARLGLAYNVARVETQESGAAKQTADRHTTTPIYGLGLEYPINKDATFMVNADMSRLRVGGELPHVKFYSAGVGLRF